MGVKYVKDFSFPSSGGFHGDVQRYAKGGHVTKVPSKAKPSYKDVPARAKPNAPAKGAPKMESKPKVGKGQGYEKGGYVPGKEKDVLPVKRPPGMGKDLAPARRFKGKYEGYAEGGEVFAFPTPDSGIVVETLMPPDFDPADYEGRGEDRGGRGEVIAPSPLAQMGDELPFDRTKYNNWYEDPRYLPQAPPEQQDRYIGGGDPIPSIPGNIGPEFPLMTTMPVPDRPRLRSEVVGRSPLAQAARRRAMMAREDMAMRPGMRVPMYAKGGEVKGKSKIAKVMGEYKRGELHSGSKKGPKVKSRDQAIAIALSEARKAGAKIPKKAEGGIFDEQEEIRSLGRPKSYAESGSAGGSNISFKDAFRKAREQGLKEFNWRGDRYTTKLKEEVKSERKVEEKPAKKAETKKEMSASERQREFYLKNPEPGLKSVAPEEVLFGPKAKAALAGAGAAAAGYGVKKLRDMLMRRGESARKAATDVSKGDLAMARSAAARESEAKAMEGFKKQMQARQRIGARYAKGGEVFSTEYLAYGDKKGPYRGSPKKAKMLGRQDRRAREAMERAEKYAPGMSLDMKAKGGMAKHKDVKMDKAMMRKAVHKHEKAMHPGKKLTKLSNGGVPSYGRKPMYGGGKC